MEEVSDLHLTIHASIVHPAFMDMKKAMLAAMQEYLLPELQEIKSGQARLETELNAINKRLDDVNLHLADQSRRIDETNNRIDAVREELGSRIDETNNRIDTTNSRIDSVREELTQSMIAINKRLDHLYEVIVRRDEHSALVIKIGELDKEVQEIKQRLAA